MNLCTNPGFEVNTDGWSVVRTALTRITGDYKYGAACGQALGDGGGVGFQYIRFTLASQPAKGVYVISLWVKAPDAEVPYFTLYLSNGTDDVSTATIALPADGEWHQYELTLVATVAHDLYVDVYTNFSGNTGRADKLYVDGIVLEQAPNPLLRGVL